MVYARRKIDLIYGDLTYNVRSLLFEVHRELGRYSKEKQYADLFEKKLNDAGLKYQRELVIADSGNIVDFLINNVLIVELKSKPFLLKSDYYQVQRYLQATQLKLGLLINFRSEYLNPQRVLLAKSVDISRSDS